MILGTTTRLRPIPGGQRAAPDFSSTSSSLHAAEVSRTLVNKKDSARGERCGHYLICHHSTLTGAINSRSRHQGGGETNKS